MEHDARLDQVTPHCGDCRVVMAAMDPASVDAVVTDPPYELSFMGRSWDASGIAYDPAVWRECLRVLKPGGYLLAFGGTRTYHRLACAVEDAGFEIRDSLHWIYGSGFPKSLDVGKAIDKARREDAAPTVAVCRALRAALNASGGQRQEIDEHFGTANVSQYWFSPERNPQVPPADKWPWLREFLGLGPELDAEVWRLNGRKGTPGEAWSQREVLGRSQWNNSAHHFRIGEDHTQRVELNITAPATEDAARWEGWGTALKPSHEPIVLARKPLAGTVAANVLEHGTGALNIDGCRVGTSKDVPASAPQAPNGIYGKRPRDPVGSGFDSAIGRWPPNVLLGPEAAAELDAQSGNVKSSGIYNGDGSRAGHTRQDTSIGLINQTHRPASMYADQGGVSRFFPVFRYQAKAPRSERPRLPDGTTWPTVKPLGLMRWLVRLVTPLGGRVLDPFAGTGTTGEACALEGFDCVLIEQDPKAVELARIRLGKPVQPMMGV